MALVLALRFSESTGAICVDQESWHLRNRKTFFSDCIYSLVPTDIADRLGVELIYAGVGHPSYHLEVATKAERKIKKYCSNLSTAQSEPLTSECGVKQLAEIVLEVFSGVHRRRISDKLHYLYGFSDEEFLGRVTVRGKTRIPIKQQKVVQHCRDILEGKESTGYPPLSPAVEACLIGVDRRYGFSGFTLKESDGVLSFHSCGFDALGCGKYFGAASFAKLLNNLFLETRRKGVGIAHGLYSILNAMVEGIDHSGQVGGNIRLVMIDGNGKTQRDRISVLFQNAALLALEIVRACRNQFISRKTAEEYLVRLIEKNSDWESVENDLFSTSDSPEKLEKLFRCYKLDEPQLPEVSIAAELYVQPVEQPSPAKKSTKKGARK